jgi:hypothetical protein
VDFGVLNDNLIKELISFIKCIIQFLMKVQLYSIDSSLEVKTYLIYLSTIAYAFCSTCKLKSSTSFIYVDL